jgi:hypothetical protein
MSTLKEALRSALDNWNEQTNKATQPASTEPAPTPATPTSTPADKQTKTPKAKILFDYILANPGKKINEIAVALLDQGVGTSTTTTYIYQLIKAGLIHQDKDKTLYSLQPEYAPIRLLTAIATRNAPPKYKPKLKPGPKPKKKPTLKPGPKPKTTYPIDFTLTPVPPTPTQAATQPQDKLPPEQFADDIIASLGAQTAAILRRKLNEMFQ